MSWGVKSRDDGRAMIRCMWRVAAWGREDQGQLGGYERQEAASPWRRMRGCAQEVRYVFVLSVALSGSFRAGVWGTSRSGRQQRAPDCKMCNTMHRKEVFWSKPVASFWKSCRYLGRVMHAPCNQETRFAAKEMCISEKKEEAFNIRDLGKHKRISDVN